MSENRKCVECGVAIYFRHPRSVRCEECQKNRNRVLSNERRRVRYASSDAYSCTHPGCDFKAQRKNGYCSAHSERKRRGMDMDHPPIKRRQKPGAVCKVEGCGDLPLGGFGMCSLHYRRFKNNIPLNVTKVSHRQARFYILELENEIERLHREIKELKER